MKAIYLSFLMVLSTITAQSQTVVFSDDFESGLGSWTVTGQWGLSTNQAFNGSNSLSDSPSGLYLNQQTTYATMSNSVDLSSALDANVAMKVKFDIENGFDYCYLEMSGNNGSTWTTLHTFNGENNLANWNNLEVNAGGFVGNSQVKIRFRFYTDAAYQADGIYVDSLRIVSDTVDNAPPLIVHEPDPHFEGQLDTNYRYVTITDISGVADATLEYAVDAGTPQSINPIDTNGNVFTFAIPPQAPGSYVDYQISATDSAPSQNSGSTNVFQYIAGNYIKHDNGVVSTVANFTSTGILTGVANRITLDGQSQLTTALIRNYTDINNPNDSIEVHIWTNNNGQPGNDIITPFNVFPEANLLEPQRMTRIDLRPLANQLDSLDGSIFIGFEVPSGSAWVVQTTGSNGRGYTLNSGNWTSSTTTYHFRAITSEPQTPPEAEFSYDATNDPSVDFTDESIGQPIAWHWDFGDGDTSNLQNPSHNFDGVGTYNVCLTATNIIGNSSPHCEQVTIANARPVAMFVANTNNDPTIIIDEFSQNNPTQWDWTFGDGNTSTLQEPEHTYLELGTYDVCLVATNQYGSDTACQNIQINNQIPIPFFTYEVGESNIVSFENETSIGFPVQTDYKWHFDNNNDSSTVFEPDYNFPNTGGIFEVCLTASNAVGKSEPYCSELDLDDLTVGVASVESSGLTLAPNPATDRALITSKSGDILEDLQVYSIDGNLIQQSKNINENYIEIDVSDLSSGLYFISIRSRLNEHHQIPLIVK
ncbi:MAG: PKD domain-containing protein [Salibacteraceae bacterium]